MKIINFQLLNLAAWVLVLIFWCAHLQNKVTALEHSPQVTWEDSTNRKGIVINGMEYEVFTFPDSVWTQRQEVLERIRDASNNRTN